MERLTSSLAAAGLLAVLGATYIWYEKADPNFVMLTPNMEHIAESVLQKDLTRSFNQSDICALERSDKTV
ncbi:unnamed protein product [Amaranthus hypochondriacus]